MTWPKFPAAGFNRRSITRELYPKTVPHLPRQCVKFGGKKVVRWPLLVSLRALLRLYVRAFKTLTVACNLLSYRPPGLPLAVIAVGRTKSTKINGDCKESS